MNRLINSEFIQLFENYPISSQENTSDPLVIAKLFDAFGSATWYLTEFNPINHIAFGYVTGLMEDEWGYVSLDELSEIELSNLGVPRIEQDLYFTQQRFSKLVQP
ncbi:MAG: DUF2958 domain-containing protein [Gammaproteobacteria bacterium]|nr:DUF2958 domain-containing protein [Gammaproteobacteria bacterium]